MSEPRERILIVDPVDGTVWCRERNAQQGEGAVPSGYELLCPVCAEPSVHVAYEQDMQWQVFGDILTSPERFGEPRILLSPCGHVVASFTMRLLETEAS